MIAVVFALKNEVSGLVREMAFKRRRGRDFPSIYESRRQKELILVEGGVGKERAEEATRKVIEEFRPGAIISVGFAGGVRPGTHTGELIVCKKIFSLSGPPAFWSPKDLDAHQQSHEDLLSAAKDALDKAEIEYRLADCLSVTSLVSHVRFKRWIGESFPVHIVDMESYWVGKVAAVSSVPFLAIRTVLDTVEEDLPSFVVKIAESNGKGSVPKAIRYAIGNPFRIVTLRRLSKQSNRAQQTLSDALHLLLPDLQIPEKVLTGV